MIQLLVSLALIAGLVWLITSGTVSGVWVWVVGALVVTAVIGTLSSAFKRPS